MTQVGPMPYPMINKLGDEGVFMPGRRYLMGGSNFTTPLSLATAQSIGDKVWAFSKERPGAATEGSVCMLECFPNKVTNSVPASATAFNNRGNYMNVGACWTWGDASLDQDVREYNRKFQSEVRAMGYNDEGLKDGVGQYINYASTGSMTAETAFGSNANRLRELKKKYDPTNVFDKLWKLADKVDEKWAV